MSHVTTDTAVSASAADVAARIGQRLDGIFKSGEIVVPGKPTQKLVNHVTRTQGNLLRDLVVKADAKRTLEIGMGTGLSGLHICWGLAKVAEQNGHDVGKHLAVDPFQDKDYWQSRGLALRDDVGLRDIFEWTGEFDDIALPRLYKAGESFDFIFIDGDHRFEAAMLDFYYCDKMLPVGGVMVIDDTDWPSVWRVVNFARRHRSYEWVGEIKADIGPLTRPWGWKLRWRRVQQFRSQGWPVREALFRPRYQCVALKKVAENDRPEDFWAPLE